MKFSYNWLKALVNFKEPAEKLAELLSLRSFEVEMAGKVGRDFALDAKIPTNRISDAGHHVGLAREIVVISGRNPQSQTPNLRPIQKPHPPPKFLMGDKKSPNPRPPIQVKIAGAQLCPRYVAQALEIKNLGASPRWMQERLATCGIRSVNAVVDITNYVMLELGQPLHAFDLDKILGGKMNIREAREGETLITLDGTKHILPKGAIIIEDAKRIIDLAGIMGGENSAVSTNTKKILLQAAVFDPVRIYKTTKALNFSSPAAKIYTAGIDPNQSLTALERAVQLLQITGVEPQYWGSTPVIDIYPEKVSPRKILFRTDYADRIIGQELGTKFYRKVFERLGFNIKSGRRGWAVEIPTDRLDIQVEEDLIEEAVRLYGYENLRAKLPESILVPAKLSNGVFWERRAVDCLVGAGFSESQLYEFTGEQELDRFFIDRSAAVELENPMNPETKYLVPRILIKYVASVAENLRNYDQVKIFGVGKSFQKIPSGIDEHKDLIVAIAKKDTGGGEGFYRLKGAVDQMLENLGISDHWYDDGIESGIRNKELRIFHPYRVAEIKVGDEKIGNIGEVHPEILKNIRSKARIVAAEIDFGKLWKLATSEAEYRPMGKYPAIIRDIAVIVPENTRSVEVQNILENLGGKLLVDTDLFDYFQDEMMRERSQKSLAFHLIFQSPERTLKDEEVNKITEKIVAALEEKGWEVRK